jgi:hypothetical protein
MWGFTSAVIPKFTENTNPYSRCKEMESYLTINGLQLYLRVLGCVSVRVQNFAFLRKRAVGKPNCRWNYELRVLSGVA